ncbi:NUDIX domain-containing protein [Patescibacteria group bacterium]|nr:NUDIX domain-containing protein [Patescibacteria group bacterium]
MPKEQSAGAVIFRIENKEPRYLLLHYPTGARTKKEYWDFPKGHLEKGETEKQAALREVAEETGLRDVFFVPGFKQRIQYYFRIEGKTIFKTVVFFLAFTKKKKVKISFEHKGFIWLPFEEAMKKLKFTNARRILTRVHHFLKKQKQDL